VVQNERPQHENGVATWPNSGTGVSSSVQARGDDVRLGFSLNTNPRSDPPEYSVLPLTATLADGTKCTMSDQPRVTVRAKEKKNLDVVHAICRLVAEEKGVALDPLLELIKYVEDRPGHDLRYAIDPTKITRELGWNPRENFETGLPIAQDLKLRMVPVTGIVRFLPAGRASTFQPYVGAGLAAINWRYSESGEFVDENFDIFVARFSETGTSLGAVFVLGGRIPIDGDIYGLTLEYRHIWGEGDTGGIANGFLGDKIDLSVVVNVGNYGEASYADFAAFVTGANAADKAVMVGLVGSTGYAAVDYNTDGTVDFMIELTGLNSLGNIDVASFV